LPKGEQTSRSEISAKLRANQPLGKRQWARDDKTATGQTYLFSNTQTAGRG